MKNEIEIKDGIVRKTYASRMDFLREEKLYKLLAGSGLAPEYLDSMDGCLEHEYVSGDNFIELLAAAEDNYDTLAAYFEKFYEWYQKYRSITNMTLGQVRFEKFIMKDGRLINLEFENCKPGYFEEDLAKLAAQMCMVPEAFAQTGIEMARFFICVGAQNMEYNSERLYQFMPKAIKAECEARSIEYDAAKAEYIAAILTSTGIIFAGGQTPLEEMTDPMAFLPQKLISLPRGRSVNKIDIPGFVNIQTDAGINNTLERIVGSQKDAGQYWTLCVTTDMPRLPEILWNELLSCEKQGKAGVVIEAGGKLREFPLILNNSMTRLELQNALDSGEKSLTDVLSKLPVRILRLEDIK